MPVLEIWEYKTWTLALDSITVPVLSSSALAMQRLGQHSRMMQQIRHRLRTYLNMQALNPHRWPCRPCQARCTRLHQRLRRRRALRVRTAALSAHSRLWPGRISPVPEETLILILLRHQLPLRNGKLNRLRKIPLAPRRLLSFCGHWCLTLLCRLQPGRDYPVCCLYPGCSVKPFKRRADLDRHYKHRHACESRKQSYNCDYPRCSRRRDPFHRLDHFRDHLREYHKEDIEKRGGPVNEGWLEERRVSSTWWRCSKCLKRVAINDYGYECPHCKTTCQAKRKEARRRR